MGSIAGAIVEYSRPQFLRSSAERLISGEMEKGCSPEIYPYPVHLEPRYEPIVLTKDFGSAQRFPLSVSCEEEPVWQTGRVWISPKHPFDWVRSELFLKGISGLTHRILFAVAGNKERVDIQFSATVKDWPVLEGMFAAHYPECRLMPDNKTLWGNPRMDRQVIHLLDYFPNLPYSHLLTRPYELKFSTLEPVIVLIGRLPTEAIGLYQVAFQPTNPTHNWHHNVDVLRDMEHFIKTLNNPLAQNRPLIPPSADNRQEAMEIENKAHNDKPFFSVAIRIGLASSSERLIDMISLDSSMCVFQHGGLPLNRLTEQGYGDNFPPDAIHQMLHLGTTYRPGFLLNSQELTGLVHLPPESALERDDVPMTHLTPFIPSDAILKEGTPIGTANIAGEDKTVYLSEDLRFRSIHIQGGPGMGKSTTMLTMILDDIPKGYGVCVLDPHGTLVDKLLYYITPEHIDRVVYVSWKDHAFAPCWNPLDIGTLQDLGRTVDEIVGAFKGLMEHNAWGNRMEHILRYGFHALLHLPGSTIRDLSTLLRRGSDESRTLIRKILKSINDTDIQQYWRNDFENYEKMAFQPPQGLLSKLIHSDTVGLTLSIPQSKIDIPHIMEKGHILLIDLSAIGPMICQILGSLLFAMLHISALRRLNKKYEDNLPFFVYADEAHKFVTDAIEDSLVEDRKAKVGWILAHHYSRQFTPAEQEALTGAGASIIMRCDPESAHRASLELQEEVTAKDIIHLDPYQAYARIHTEIVKISTLNAPPQPETHHHDQIIENSHRRYYLPYLEAKRLSNSRHRYSTPPPATEPTATGDTNHTELKYDTFP